MWRVSRDSSGLSEPRVFIRVFVGPGQLEETITSYERLQTVEYDMLFTYRAKGLRLAAVGAFLLIEGDEEAVAPFLDTAGTLLVDDAERYLERLRAEGGEIVEPLERVPTGFGFTARHRDGTLVEYVAHRPTPEGA